MSLSASSLSRAGTTRGAYGENRDQSGITLLCSHAVSQRATSIVANPVLVGAVTTLVVVVAVFLAYNANNGLPFVPTTSLYAELPNGAELTKGVEIREGG